MSTSNVETNFNVATNLHDLVKKILLAFCEVHVSFDHRLDIYGSIHVRSDDTDLTSFVLNEHSYKQTDLSNYDCDRNLTRYVSLINGTSNIETVCRQNSNALGRVSGPVRNAGRQVGVNRMESSAKYQSSEPPNAQESRNISKHHNWSAGERSSSDAVENSETLPTGRHEDSSDLVLNENGQDNDVQQGTSEISGTKGDEVMVEAEPWADTAFGASDENDPPVSLTDDGLHSTEYIKQEPDSFADIKVEPANENDIIELESDEDGFDQSGEGMFMYNSSAYNNPGLYHRYPSSTNIKTSSYSQAAWMQSETNNLPQDESQFTRQRQARRAPPQRICSFCLKTFASSMQLRLHVQRYHNSSSTPESANNAWQGHHSSGGGPDASSDKKLTCSICFLSFRSLDGLRCHENSKHSRNKLYRCQFCSEVFLTRQAAYTHRIKFHRLKPKKTESMP